MKFIDNLYFGYMAEKNKDRFINAINKHKRTEFFYVIYIEKEKLCVSHCFSFVHKKYNLGFITKLFRGFKFNKDIKKAVLRNEEFEDDIVVVGFALYKNEAFRVVARIVADSIKYGCPYDYKKLLLCNEYKYMNMRGGNNG